MSHSQKLSAAYRDIAKTILRQTEIRSAVEAKQYLEKDIDALKTDVYFQQLFETCFNIELCEGRI